MRHDLRRGFTLLEMLVVIGIIALLTGLLLAAVQRVRSAASRAKCADQMRQLGLALHQYHDTTQSFPPGVSFMDGASPQPHMTWLTRILPYLEYESLWRMSLAAFEKEKFFENPPHTDILGRKISFFVCPDDEVARTPFDFGSFTVAFTSYLGVSGTDLHSRDGVLHTDSQVTIQNITDGTTTTLLVGERAVYNSHEFGWWYAGWGQAKTGSTDSILGVRELRDNLINLQPCPPGPYQFRPGRADQLCDVLRFWSNHPGGANFLMCDGSVRFLRFSANSILPALATRAGGETVEVP
jgi:prepilin-type N-terminal cleavage/methylation domain-containing protein/prepilin-type processing-associated H-X9-DG protein